MANGWVVFQDGQGDPSGLLTRGQPEACSNTGLPPQSSEDQISRRKDAILQEMKLQKARRMRESKKSHRAARDRGRKNLTVGVGERWSG